MRVTLSGGQKLRGTIRLPGSKAFTHRALVAGLLSHGTTLIHQPAIGDDTNTTTRAILALGASMSKTGDGFSVTGPGGDLRASRTIHCKESGATLRFLTAISSVSPSNVMLTMDEALAKRPLRPLADALGQLGVKIGLKDSTVLVRGPLEGGTARLPGDVSSQFISALLFASPLARNDVNIIIEGRLESQPYVAMTLEVMKRHRVRVEKTSNGYTIPARQEYVPADHIVPSDFSSASFIMTGIATSGGSARLSSAGLGDNSLEPDYRFVRLLQDIGMGVEETNHEFLVTNDHGFRNFDFDARDNPDLVPALEALGCYARGRSTITGATRLRYKESDRWVSVPNELAKLGARITLDEGSISIDGATHLKGAELSSHNDHRVVMAGAAAALGAEGFTTIEGAEAVSKSYPQFFDHLSQLGANIHVE